MAILVFSNALDFTEARRFLFRTLSGIRIMFWISSQLDSPLLQVSGTNSKLGRIAISVSSGLVYPLMKLTNSTEVVTFLPPFVYRVCHKNRIIFERL